MAIVKYSPARVSYPHSTLWYIYQDTAASFLTTLHLTSRIVSTISSYKSLRLRIRYATIATKPWFSDPIADTNWCVGRFLLWKLRLFPVNFVLPPWSDNEMHMIFLHFCITSLTLSAFLHGDCGMKSLIPRCQLLRLCCSVTTLLRHCRCWIVTRLIIAHLNIITIMGIVSNYNLYILPPLTFSL